MNNQKLISIIVPIYKVEEYLDACVESLIHQTYENLEVILVDDGSPDNCGLMCDQWAKKDDRIRVIHKENGGLSDARNAGMKVAAGDYIGFVDSDDVIHPNMYGSLLLMMTESDSEIACCGVTRDISTCYCNQTSYNRTVSCESSLSDSQDIQTGSMYAESKDWKVFSSIEAIESLLRLEDISVTVWNKLYKREVLENIEFPKEKYHEDEFWTYRVLERAKRVAYTEAAYYGYRERGESITTQRYTSRHLDFLDGRAERLEYLQMRYPQFYSLERTNIRFECIRAMQLCLIHMSGKELKICRARIHKLVKKYPLKYKDYKKLPFGRQIWCFLSNVTFDGTCKIRNYFHYGP